ncbi:hypothetical protein AB5J49_09345 [Streptomyces sp. R28]|uniref:Uncharacterized protein n=1 Tax=Streptomyces sp. R28 TaxID=3238628 RepID=A0AB39PTV0_9ACTN
MPTRGEAAAPSRADGVGSGSPDPRAWAGSPGSDGSRAVPSPRSSGVADSVRAGSTGADGSGAPSRPPHGDRTGQGPAAAGAAPTSPPPPRASARFPDAPPTAGHTDADEGRRDSGGSLRREDAGQPAPGGIPPRPAAERPATPRRTGAPAETAAETTFRLRPIPAEPSPAADNRPSATRGPAAAPPQQGTGPAQGSVGMPQEPATHPDAAPAEPARPAGPGPLPPLRPTPEPSAGHGPASRAYAASNPAGPTHAEQQATNGHAAGGHGHAAAFSPDPSLSWSAPMAPGGAPGAQRPLVSFGEPEGYDAQARPRPLGVRIRPRVAGAAACVVLGLGLIGGALTGSWLIGDPGEAGAQDTFAAAGSLWHSVPVDKLFPPTVIGQGAGPGGADRTWTRIAVAPDTGCANAFDPLLRKALAPAGCQRLLRATYIDATQSYVTTVGLLFTKADAAAMRALETEFTKAGLDRRSDLMPRPYAAKGTLAAGFGGERRASWTVSVLTDAPVVVYAVSGWADGRTVDEPEPAREAMQSGATTDVAQAGLGHEAQGLADRIERALRKNVSPSTEQSS